MKSTLFTTVIFFSVISCAFAQKAFTDNTKIISFGAGFGTPYWPDYYVSNLPFNPTVSVEKSVADEISVGTTFAYSSAKWDKSTTYKNNALYLAGRAAYHFGISNENVDLYAGGSLGYTIVWLSNKQVTGTVAGVGNGVGYSLFGGGRYYFAKKLGVYAELGYGSFSIANVGISIRAY